MVFQIIKQALWFHNMFSKLLLSITIKLFKKSLDTIVQVQDQTIWVYISKTESDILFINVQLMSIKSPDPYFSLILLVVMLYVIGFSFWFFHKKSISRYRIIAFPLLLPLAFMQRTDFRYFYLFQINNLHPDMGRRIFLTAMLVLCPNPYFRD